jgi:RimJ/RimL family protein N-acetyltransferase
MQPPLSSSRLVLEPVRVEDFPYLYALWSEPLVRRYLFDDRFVSLALARSVFETCLEGRERGTGLWVVQNADRSARLGCVGLNLTTVVAEAEPRLAGLLEPVVALHPSQWQQGYAVEAGVVLTHAFESQPNASPVRLTFRTSRPFASTSPSSQKRGPVTSCTTCFGANLAWRAEVRLSATDQGDCDGVARRAVCEGG